MYINLSNVCNNYSLSLKGFNLEVIKKYNLPITNSDFCKLLDFLKKFNPYISYQLYEEDLYHYPFFIENNVIALLDRNIVSRVAKLALGKEIPKSERESYKVASAIMAFLIITDSLIEPSVSLHELHNNLITETEKELIAFRIGDNLHPQIYLDILLDRINKIRSKDIAIASKKINLDEKISNNFVSNTNDWKLKYLYTLVAVTIKKDESMNPGEQFLKAINWMFDEALFDFVVYIFFLIFFSNKKQEKIIKKINSSNKRKLKDGIQNAAWDLSYLQYLKNKSSSNDGYIYVFATNDKLLKFIGCSLNEIYEHKSIVIKKTIRELYSANFSKKIIDKVTILNKKILSESRKSKANNFYSSIEEKIIMYEKILFL